MNIICVQIPSEKLYQALSSQNFKMFINLLWIVISHHSNIWMGKFVTYHHWTLWGQKKGLHNMLNSLLIWIIQNMLTLHWQVNIITMIWAHEILHINIEDLNFQNFASTFIRMHYLCPETSIYVPIACVIFHHTIIYQVQIQLCSKAWEVISSIRCHGYFGFCFIKRNLVHFNHMIMTIDVTNVQIT
jgi:hypothetical protein